MEQNCPWPSAPCESSSYKDVCLPDQRKRLYVGINILNQFKQMPEELPALAWHPVTALRWQGMLCMSRCPNPNLTIGSKVDGISQAFYPNKEPETFPLPPPPPWEKQGPGLRLAHFFLKSQTVVILGLQARGLCHNYHLCHEHSHNST